MTDKPIKINYLNRLCNHINIPEGTSFSFTPCTLSKRPKNILVGFKDADISFGKNNNLFLIKGLKSIQLKLNNVYYPQNQMNFDSEKNDLVLPYNSYLNMSRKYTDSSSLSLMDFKNSFPIFCFDVNAQDDALLSSNCMITIEIKKDTNFKATCYTLVMEENLKQIKLKDGMFISFENIE